jgi:hypothetical protein
MDDLVLAGPTTRILRSLRGFHVATESPSRATPSQAQKESDRTERHPCLPSDSTEGSVKCTSTVVDELCEGPCGKRLPPARPPPSSRTRLHGFSFPPSAGARTASSAAPRTAPPRRHLLQRRIPRPWTRRSPTVARAAAKRQRPQQRPWNLRTRRGRSDRTTLTRRWRRARRRPRPRARSGGSPSCCPSRRSPRTSRRSAGRAPRAGPRSARAWCSVSST